MTPPGGAKRARNAQRAKDAEQREAVARGSCPSSRRVSGRGQRSARRLSEPRSWGGRWRGEGRRRRRVRRLRRLRRWRPQNVLLLLAGWRGPGRWPCMGYGTTAGNATECTKAVQKEQRKKQKTTSLQHFRHPPARAVATPPPRRAALPAAAHCAHRETAEEDGALAAGAPFAATPPLACIRPTSAALRVGVNVALASAKGSSASLVAGGTYARTLKQS